MKEENSLKCYPQMHKKEILFWTFKFEDSKLHKSSHSILHLFSKDNMYTLSGVWNQMCDTKERAGGHML